MSVRPENLDEVGWFGHRQARTNLAATDHQLDTATQELNRIETAAAPTHTRRAAAGQELAAARNDRFYHDILDRWNYRPEHIHQIQQQLSALDHWHTWASGRPITAEQLHTITTILGVDHGQRRGELGALRGAVQQWAVHNHIELHPTLAPPVRQVERDRGLSL